jgi:mannose-1-phosphate guanylyltransferase
MNEFSNFYAVIMAGGGGTRLWPLSRKKTPKQVVKFTGETTLFQMSVDRLKGLFPYDHIFVVTVAEQVGLLSELVPEIPISNYLIEPFPKGTASVVGYAATYLNFHFPNSIMAVLTADHFIQNISEFHTLLKNGYAIAKNNFLVTLGIQPTYPSTGFGYIQHDQSVNEIDGISAYRVKKFKEKPKLEIAKSMVENGDHLWNSGMFIWKTDVILKEFRHQMPELFSTLDQLNQALTIGTFQAILNDVWVNIKPETIDFGIMENARNVIVIPAIDLGWNDVGSWESLFDVILSNENGNILIGQNHFNLETKNSLVYSQTPDKLVATIGLENIIVVEVGNAILVCSREKAQEVKTIVKYLNDHGMADYL